MASFRDDNRIPRGGPSLDEVVPMTGPKIARNMTEVIYEYVIANPGHTAYEISRAINRTSDSVSSTLLALFRRGKVTRWKPDDIRRGYEYGPVPKD